MTRQKVTDGPREVMTRKCPTCAGDGIVVSDATVALQVERRLRALAVAGTGSRVQAYRIAVHPRTLLLLAGPGGARLSALEDATRRKFYLVPAEGHTHADHFEVVAEGRRDDLAPTTPIADGAELEVKLVELALHDASAAVGKVDGVDVVVADAAKLVGKKASVTVGRVLEGQAFATLVAGEGAAAPITFESEAEKPTRAPARRKADDAAPDEATPDEATPDEAAPDEAAVIPELVSVPEGEAEPEPTEEAPLDEAEPVVEGAETEGSSPEDGAQAPAKKRTRRGSRGGKRRRKPVPASDVTEADGPQESPEPPESQPDTAAPRRRKSRLGRRRRPGGASRGSTCPTTGTARRRRARRSRAHRRLRSRPTICPERTRHPTPSVLLAATEPRRGNAHDADPGAGRTAGSVRRRTATARSTAT